MLAAGLSRRPTDALKGSVTVTRMRSSVLGHTRG